MFVLVDVLVTTGVVFGSYQKAYIPTLSLPLLLLHP